MKTYLFPLFLLLLSILSASCTKEVRYTKEQILSLALEADPSVKVIVPRVNDKELPTCNNSDYPPGCINVFVVSVKSIEILAVEFPSEEQAKFAAKKVRGYYLHNWLFDDVTGEPIMERFVEEKLKAKKP
jgi:hypothetical protein